MALSSCPSPILIKDSSLSDWTVIGSGGFGQIFKARHLQWCCDVAIKLLHYDDGTSTSLLREIDMMRTGSSPYVIQVLGVFKGRPPGCGLSVHLGLVMEVMERGSLATLQSKLCETPPLPLAFRLAHQVALGINFLHNLSPALLHLDLKPNNVLLDSYLNAKLTDFGLARFYHSVSQGSKKNSENEGGTNSYKPPEAFDMSYTPTRASDIYSYGILLWSILTGKQPYANAMSSLVRFRIPQGDRPSLDEIRCQPGRAGVTGLMDLMVRCWETTPNQRPSSYECTLQTEELYKMHKHGINDAVHTVLKKLDENDEESLSEQVQRVHITEASAIPTIDTQNHGENELTCHTPVQEMDGNGWNTYHKDNATVRDAPPPQLPSAFQVKLERPSIDHKVKMSSVHPIQSSTPYPPNGNSLQNRTPVVPQQGFSHLNNQSPQYQRQSSIPDALLHYPISGPRGLHIHMSNVTGFQQGENNSMTIYGERKRHPTAPSSISFPRTHTMSRRDKMGGVG